MRTSLKFLIPVLAAMAALAGCGSSSKTSSSSAGTASQPAAPATSAGSQGSSAVVKTASNTKLGGTILVDAQGMTLYSLSAERNGRFICTNAACLQLWHPLSAAAGAPSGTVAKCLPCPSGM